MLSIMNLSSAAQAGIYYSGGDYYEQDKDGKSADELGAEFGGNGSKLLELGEYDHSRFVELLEGKISSDIQLGRKGKGGDLEHRPGWDLTFSAPKSVSLMALVGGDERLIEAHQAASRAAMSWLEANHATVRVQQDGDTRWQKTGNLGWGAFTHATSRKLEPQLHTHNVVFNASMDKEGQWRSLESKPLFQSKMTAGMLYRSALAMKCQELGYDIRSKDGYFELAAVSQELIDANSSRRMAIKAAAEERGLEGGKQMEQAALFTRESKKNAERGTLRDEWQRSAKEMGYSLESLVPSQAASKALNQDLSKDALQQDIKLACKHLGTYEAVFRHDAIVGFLGNSELGKYSLLDVEKGLVDLVKAGELKPSLMNDGSFTTVEAFKKESYVLNLMDQGKGKYRPVMSERKVRSHIKMVAERSQAEGKGDGLTSGQESGLKTVLCSKDQFVGIQGLAGTGKTFMLREAKALAESARWKVRGFAPTGSAADKLFQESGIKSGTLDGFVYSRMNELQGKRSATPAKKELWIVDESGLANMKLLADFMTLARKSGAKVVFQGDTNQLGSVEWGKAFQLFQDHGMKTASLDEIARQRDMELKAAVYASLKGDYDAAMRNLGGRVREVANNPERVSALVKEWSSMTSEERDGALVVIPDIETRDAVSMSMRDSLQERGELGLDQVITSVYRDSKLSDPLKEDSRFYREGMVVEFQKNFATIGVKQGDRWEVQSVQSDKVHLKNSDGSTLAWSPREVAGGARYGVEVFNIEKRALAIGDKIRWNKTRKPLDLKNGDKGKIIDIDRKKGEMRVMFGDKGERTLNLSEHKNFDYDYVSTAFGSQGLDASRVLVMAESWRRNLVNQKSFYVMLSRAKDRISVFTDSSTKLRDGLDMRKGDKTSALEHQGIAAGDFRFNDPLRSNSIMQKVMDALKRKDKAPQERPQGRNLQNKGRISESSEKVAVKERKGPVR